MVVFFVCFFAYNKIALPMFRRNSTEPHVSRVAGNIFHVFSEVKKKSGNHFLLLGLKQ